jgi:hypothetical protein
MPHTVILAAVAALGAVVLATMGPAGAAPSPRFASDDATYAVSGWSLGPAEVGGRPGVAFFGREYRSPDGVTARLSITTSPQAKSVYRAGADVPFLGSGYSVEPAPVDVVPLAPGREAVIARRGSEAWLQLASFGESRGVLGSGVQAWSLAIFDLALGHTNDYYLVRVRVPYDGPNARAALELADTLFPRLAAFYGARA